MATSDDVTTTITDTNDVPVNIVPDTSGGPLPQTTTPEDSPLVFSAAGGNLIAIDDPDGDAPTVTISVLNGTLTANAASGATITSNGTSAITISGTQAQINGALDGLIYSNTPDYNGTDTLTIATDDGSGTANATDTDTVEILVTPVADSTDDTVATNEDLPVNFNVLTGTNGASADSFESGGALVTGVTQGSNGSVTFDSAGNITYTPDLEFSGTDQFTYTVTSGGVTETATVDVNIAVVNDPPVANPNTASGAEDGGPVTGDVEADDTDIDSALLTVTEFSIDGIAGTFTAGTSVPIPSIGTLVINADGTFSFQPVADYNSVIGGAVPQITYTITDGTTGQLDPGGRSTITHLDDVLIVVAIPNATPENTTVHDDNAAGRIYASGSADDQRSSQR